MLDLILAPDPIYKTICKPVPAVDERVRSTLDAMMETLQTFHALGIAAPMVGLSERLVVIELEDEEGKLHRYKMANPEVTARSAEMATMAEGSITFPGIEVTMTRPAEVTVRYTDENAAQQMLTVKGILAVCLQHEIDYLDGKTILDSQPPMKRDILKRKLEKNKRLGLVPHVHGAHCNHG